MKKKSEKSKAEIEADMQAVEQALTFKLSDIEGVGPKKMAQLEDHGIRTPSDLVVKGARELSEILGMDLSATSKMVESARRFLQNKGVTKKAIMTSLDLLNYNTETRYELTTGIDEFDKMLGGGLRSGVITEFYGQEGSGKTNIVIREALLAQTPYKMKCFKCGKIFEDQDTLRCDVCLVKNIKIGGLSKKDKPCRVIYMDTEGSYEPQRVLQLIYENEMVPTKEQTKEEIKAGADKEPKDEEALQKAHEFLKRIVYIKPVDSAHQSLLDEELGNLINAEGEEVARLVIVDSLTGSFRLEYPGRGSLSDRQVALTPHIRHLSRIASTFNVVVLVTNQVQMDLNAGSYADPTKPIGGMAVAHTSKNRIYLRKGGNKEGSTKIIAILKDSPYMAVDEVVLKLNKKGIEIGEA